MAQRLRLYDLRISRLPGLIGLCQSDISLVAEAVNTAQERLLLAKEAGSEGWWGTWAEMAFNVSRSQPYLTLPRQVARLEAVLACNEPVPVQNQFYEYLNFGNGRLPKQFRTCDRSMITQGFMRNNAVTFIDLSSAPQRIVLYPTDAADIGKRVLLQGLDSNGIVVESQDGAVQVNGVFVQLESPFSISPMTFNSLTGIQKDITSGPVQIFQQNPTTAEQILLSTMEPGEETASYRRYYFDELPCGCCQAPGAPCTSVQLTALAKLELIPVRVDTDYCLIQNKQAIIEECQSVRYSGVDEPTAKQMSRERHNAAIGFLNGELAHYLGIDQPAVSVAPFGTARLSRQRIGNLM